MSTKRTLGLAATFLLLAIYFLVFEGITVESPVPEWEKGEKIVSCPADGASSIRVSAGSRAATGERRDGAWTLSPPARLQVAANAAAESLASALCDLPIIDRIADPGSLADYGLASPAAEIRIGLDGRHQVISVGDFTPARNLMYVRKDGDPAVLKVGALLSAEVKKVLAFAEEPGGSAAEDVER